MALVNVSSPQKILAPPGNSLAIFVNANDLNKMYLKDDKGNIQPLSDFLPTPSGSSPYIYTNETDFSVVPAGYDCNTNNAANAKILGGFRNCIDTLSVTSTIVNGDDNVFNNAPYALIGAGVSHRMTNSETSVIGGGLNNTHQDSPASFIGAGCLNTTNQCFSFIGSGYCSTIFAPSASCEASFIGAGVCNVVCSSYSFLGSGYQNAITEDYSVVTGGCQNCNARDFSFIGAGNNNCTGSRFSVVVGGSSNCTMDQCYQFIGGGTSNITSCLGSLIVGGIGNIACGEKSEILGGCFNTTMEAFSCASGYSSCAYLYGMRSNANGCFLNQADNQTSEVTVWKRDNIDASATTVLFLDGISKNVQISDANRAWSVMVQWISVCVELGSGTTDGLAVGSSKIGYDSFIFKRVAGVTTISAIDNISSTDDAGMNTASLDYSGQSGGALKIIFTAPTTAGTGTEFRISAKLTLKEIAW